MSEQRVTTLDAFARIPGVGATKLVKYGDEFVQEIRQFAQSRDPDGA